MEQDYLIVALLFMLLSETARAKNQPKLYALLVIAAGVNMFMFAAQLV